MKFVEQNPLPSRLVRPVIIREFDRRPSASSYMTRILLPSPGLPGDGQFPSSAVRWRRIRIDRSHLRSFLEATGLPAGESISILGTARGAAAPLLYPHVFGFPLIMALVTHSTFPLSLWRALQIRNHFLLHRPYSELEVLDLVVRTAGHRILARGIEVDLHALLSSRGNMVWEGLTTFYFRGSYGPGQAASPLAKPHSGAWPDTARWTMPPNGHLLFANLTGDYNGIHWQNWYARLMGFKTSLYHPQQVIGQCLLRLAAPDGPVQRLDTWLKGPVYHNSSVTLGVDAGPREQWFSLTMDGKHLPSIIGRWSAAAEGTRLLDEQDNPLPLNARERGSLTAGHAS